MRRMARLSLAAAGIPTPASGFGRATTWASADDGRSWERLAAIAPRPGDRADDYRELHGVEAADGRLVVHIRNHSASNTNVTLQTESTDGGRNWSVPHPIGVWGLQSHLLRLRDGRLVMSYGHRRPPFGNQARVSQDRGRSWSQPVPISEDGAGSDLGYPPTEELGDGSLLTVWYERLAGQPRRVAQTPLASVSGSPRIPKSGNPFTLDGVYIFS
jgi:hypothetical protein